MKKYIIREEFSGYVRGYNEYTVSANSAEEALENYHQGDQTSEIVRDDTHRSDIDIEDVQLVVSPGEIKTKNLKSLCLEVARLSRVGKGLVKSILKKYDAEFASDVKQKHIGIITNELKCVAEEVKKLRRRGQPIVKAKTYLVVFENGLDGERIEQEISDWVYLGELVSPVEDVANDWAYNYYDKGPYEIISYERIKGI